MILAAVRRGLQVILSTHSLELIDNLLSEFQEEELDNLSVFGLKLNDGCMKSYRLNGKQVQTARTLIQEDLR